MSTMKVDSIVSSGGTNTAQINGITPALASQAQAQAGTDNTTLMTPLRALECDIGRGQTWQDVLASRVVGTSYQNTTGKPLQVHLYGNSGTNNADIQLSSDNSTWIDVGRFGAAGTWATHVDLIIPPNWYYRNNKTAAVWLELR